MYNTQIQQAQQKINTVQQMASQVKQSETYAVQQLQRIQQICQEVVTSLQNVSTQQGFAGVGQTAGVYSTTPFQYGTQQYGTQFAYDPSISFSQQPQQFTQGLGQQSYQMGAGTLSDIATMSPDVYLASRNQLGIGTPTLNQIGQQAGVTQSVGTQTTGTQGGLGTQGFGNVGQQAGMASGKSYNQ